ncbi:MAG: DUF2680 domain-containing protein [Acidobacteriota bacterium]
MKKWIIAIIAIALVAIPLTAYAAGTNAPLGKGFCGINFSTLTDKQKADLQDNRQQMMDLKKEQIQKMVANGTLTKEQGDSAIKRIDDRLKSGTPCGGGFGGGRGGSGRGMGGQGGCGACPFASSN